jgi:hypothetical protein
VQCISCNRNNFGIIFLLVLIASCTARSMTAAGSACISPYSDIISDEYTALLKVHNIAMSPIRAGCKYI